jgi:Tol biopolymer transport system component
MHHVTAPFIFLAAASLALGAAGERPLTFSLPDSILLFGTYDDLRVAKPEREIRLKAPADACGKYNGGYFASPTISPRGDVIAWGFCTRWVQTRRQNRARFALGLYSVAKETWQIYGDFDDIGTTAYSASGSRIAFVARQNDWQQLLIFDVTKQSWTAAPYPTGGLRQNAALSWSPDEKHLVVEVQRGGPPYSPQASEGDANRNSVIGVLDIVSGTVRMLGEGYDPAWSPDGQWIAYFAPGGARCLLVHPDGTGIRVVKSFRQNFFSSRSFVWGGPVWSPDSRQLLFTASASETYVDLMLLDLVSGRTAMKLRKGYPAYGWAISPGTRQNEDHFASVVSGANRWLAVEN